MATLSHETLDTLEDDFATLENAKLKRSFWACDSAQTDSIALSTGFCVSSKRFPYSMEEPDEEPTPIDLPIGNSIVPYEDDDVRVRVVRVSQTQFLTVYERPETGHNLLVIRFDAENQSTTFELDEFEPTFWTLTVDGEEMPSDEIGRIIQEKNVISTEIKREEREVTLETEE